MVAVEVLPRREALASITSVDEDPHKIVIRARIQLHPELDRMRLVTRHGAEVICREFAVRLRSVIENDVDAAGRIRQANVGHPAALAFIRADSREEPRLLSGRFRRNERELSGVFRIGQTLTSGFFCRLGIGLEVVLGGSRHVVSI